ncbi:MAG: SDR family NAD(P)-dependent oxidoreductase [Acidobacteriaceae bacterium]
MSPQADHGETSYSGNARLRDKVAIITGADSGIGRAVAIALAREGAHLELSFLPEEAEDARETAQWSSRRRERRNCCRATSGKRNTAKSWWRRR